MDIEFYRGALFNGFTNNSLKLATVLSLGWFWYRIKGCTCLYRTETTGKLDEQNIIAVFEIDADEIIVPGYLTHQPTHSYIYLVRRVNPIGLCERTFGASVLICVGPDGKIETARPNGPFGLAVITKEPQTERVIWYYCPLDQKVRPVRFELYQANQKNAFDYNNPSACQDYLGRRYYQEELESDNPRIYLTVRSIGPAPDSFGCTKQISIDKTARQEDTIQIYKTSAV